MSHTSSSPEAGGHGGSATLTSAGPAPAADKPNRNNGSAPKWAAWIGLAVCIVVGGVIAAYYYVYSLSHKSTDDAFIDGHVVAVAPRVPGHVLKVNVVDNEPVEKGARLVELDPSDYEARLAAANAALAMATSNLEAAEINLALTRVTAVAGYDEATSGVSFARSGVNTSEARVSAARSALDEAAADVAVAQAVADESAASVAAAEAVEKRDALDLDRYRSLLKTNSITQQQLDHASAAASASAAETESARKKAAADAARIARSEAAAKSAGDALREAESVTVESRAGVDQAQARLAAANTAAEKISAAESQVGVAEAAVSAAQAAVDGAKLALSYTVVYAPQAGRVTHRTVEAGAYVQTGQALLAIVPTDIWVTANFKETQLTLMRPGQPVELFVDAFPDKVFRGHVDSIQAGAGARFSLLPPENATGNYIKVVQRIPVKIVFDDAIDFDKYFLVPGMSVVPEVNVSVPPGENVRPFAPTTAPLAAGVSASTESLMPPAPEEFPSTSSLARPSAQPRAASTDAVISPAASTDSLTPPK